MMQNDGKPKRAAIYVRVSSPGQEQDGTSLVTQEEACRAFAIERGYTIDEAHIYREVHTGVELWERPRLTALRDAARAREIDVVIAYSIDRLSRDEVHLGVVISEADHWGVAVEFVSEPLDDSLEGALIRFVKGYAGKIEHLRLKDRIKRGRLKRAQDGKLIHGRSVLFGYRWADEVKTKYAIDPANAPIVQRMFREAAEGKTLRAIAMALTQEGIPSPRKAGPWCFNVVRDILRHPSYAGRAAAFRTTSKRVPGKYVTTKCPEDAWIILPEGVVPALVDPATFEAVQERLQLNRLQSARNCSEPENYLVRGGFARCGHCGNALFVHTPPNRKPAYRCAKAMKLPGSCPSPSIRTEILDSAVWAKVEVVLTDPSIITRELERMAGDDPSAADLEGVDRALAEIARKQARLAKAIAQLDEADADPLVGELSQLGAQKRRLEAEREAVLTRRANWEAARTKLQDLQQWCTQVGENLAGFTYEQRRLALDALGVQVQVFAADHEPRYIITMSLPIDVPDAPDSDIVLHSICPTSATPLSTPWR